MATHSSNPLVFVGMLGSSSNGLGSSSPTTNTLFCWGSAAGAIRGLITSSIKIRQRWIWWYYTSNWIHTGIGRSVKQSEETHIFQSDWLALGRIHTGWWPGAGKHRTPSYSMSQWASVGWGQGQKWWWGSSVTELTPSPLAQRRCTWLPAAELMPDRSPAPHP